jgi:hypothetical protein
MTSPHIRTAGAIALIATSLLSPVAAQEQAAAIKPTEVIKLFDGKSLANFESWLVDHHSTDPERVFTVVDQIDGAPAIRVSGKVWGGLLTTNTYRDYRLVVEFRWGGVTWGARAARARDSGVLLHAQGRLGNTGKDFNGPWLRSIEFQIIEGGVGDILPVAGYGDDGAQIRPAVTTTTRKDRDGETVYDEKVRRVCCRAAGSTGGAAARTGRTESGFAERRMSRARGSNGPASKLWSRAAS